MGMLSGFPKGLLSLLGSQNFGINPKDLSDVVAPTVELSELYLLSKQVSTFQTIAAPANGTNAGAGLIVPAGEVWRVHAGGIFVITGVGVTLDITPITIVNGITCPLASTTSIAASLFRWVPMIMNPFWADAGSELGAYISALVGAPTVSIQYLVSKLRG